VHRQRQELLHREEGQKKMAADPMQLPKKYLESCSRKAAARNLHQSDLQLPAAVSRPGWSPWCPLRPQPPTSQMENKNELMKPKKSLRWFYDILPPQKKKRKWFNGLSDFVQQKYTRSKLTLLGHIPRWQIKLDLCCQKENFMTFTSPPHPFPSPFIMN